MTSEKTKANTDNAVDPAEPNWGHPTKSQIRMDTTRGEKISGIVWLTIGALAGLFISVLYLGTRFTIGGTSWPLPWTIVFAGWFNSVISRTAMLWTPNRAIAGIPVMVWLIGFVVLSAWPFLPFAKSVLVPSTLWSMLVLVVGLAGGMWPLRPRFPEAGGE
ncbi:hypothetical protein [uncultured Corynebacterium sp.]|uniref:hypothetical protein n=1 Tax=uncultured Corynebacterium sp. TaxID=159447 RepID=UPI0025E2D8E2|nr:hypothetical protein [uncultured Corynebacterium sp.]